MNKITSEGKRKIEKLLFTDISTALSVYQQKRRTQRDALQKRSVTNAPTKAKALLKTCNDAQAVARKAENELAELGFRVEGYGDVRHLGVSYNKLPADMQDFDTETKKVEQALETMKRDYTIQIHGEGVDVQKLFEALPKELAKLTK